MTRYFVDTEFIDDGKTIDLISIGIVSSDGREYHAQSVEFDADNASDWVWDHVIPSMLMHGTPFGKHAHTKSYHKSLLHRFLRLHCEGQCVNEEHGKFVDCLWRTREQIRDEVAAFLDPEQHGKPELYGWCSGYDFVALCQLFGTMMDLPAGWPHYIHDFQQVLDERGIFDDQLPAMEGDAHNALADAHSIQHLWQFVQGGQSND